METWIAVIILGIIEGITEFLPVSSTGHLLIAGHWLSPRSDLFNIVIQSGAVLAVLPLFPERLRQFFFEWRRRSTQVYLLKIAVAFGITGIGGLFLHSRGFELPETLGPVAWALLIGGIAFILVEKRLQGRPVHTDITWMVVLAVAVGQLIAAVFPGASRSGSTILLMLLLGVSRPAATEFSFLVGIPTMLAAGGLKIYSALVHPPIDALPEDWGMVLLGFVVSAGVSFIAVGWLLRFIQTHTFIVFGWYRIAVAGVLGALFLFQ
ncbi:undecaprenyl-diphosphate phosphatase [Desulfatitalea alkaliphila]|uniref:Undecaprenyl-diphosphatase n=1 Tax=Desulfatitalea alkaliphila TaxID=2929485 RepID=A0AA41UHU0_9BACT|nr:undecaprenyl-diphosphate phosphatase [Desulfatitalea alkaliphila]MCJ8498972.1 undecaprenyl-diphosphate phosphatase [Desulfatitalea alkaliphila]